MNNMDNAKISFFEKEPKKCPVCKNSFRFERLYTGGGRLYAVSTSDELRKIYKPTAVYGEINPLIYSVIVCPKCLYSAFLNDFLILQEEEIKKILQGTNI